MNYRKISLFYGGWKVGVEVPLCEVYLKKVFEALCDLCVEKGYFEDGQYVQKFPNMVNKTLEELIPVIEQIIEDIRNDKLC